jgi:hypothetical protein
MVVGEEWPGVYKTLGEFFNNSGLVRVVFHYEDVMITYERHRPMTDREKLDLLLNHWQLASRSGYMKGSKLAEVFEQVIEEEEGPIDARPPF